MKKHKVKWRILKSIFAGVLLSPVAMAFSAENSQAPNVLFIMVDDMGYADLGVTGSRNPSTYYLDRLASEGVLLTNGYANAAICSPTRTALLTGNYQYRVPLGLPEPIGPVPPEGLSYDQPTLASVFRDRGYTTALLGKWHLGEPPEHGPLQHGYDYFFGFAKGAADYFRHRVTLDKKEKNDGLYRGNKPIESEGYLTDLFTDETIRFIEKSAGKKPFMISLHFNAPHWPWEGPYDESVAEGLLNIFHRDGGSLKTYAEMMTRMDANVGRVLAKLKELGIEDNTIVVFTSDNGGEKYSDTWPYTGYKGELLEGGIHVPIIVRWPGHVEAGTLSKQVMTSMDFLPTLVAATGKPVDDGKFDGENLLDVLTGKATPRERTLFWRFKDGEQAAVRQGDWKYFKADGKEWLFNLEENPHERAQLKEKYPEKFSELRTLWNNWNKDMLPYPDNMFSHRVKDSLP